MSSSDDNLEWAIGQSRGQHCQKIARDVAAEMGFAGVSVTLTSESGMHCEGASFDSLHAHEKSDFVRRVTERLKQ